MVVFRHLVESRERLVVEVDALIAALDSGRPPGRVERQHIEIKEEPGRRGRGGTRAGR